MVIFRYSKEVLCTNYKVQGTFTLKVVEMGGFLKPNPGI